MRRYDIVSGILLILSIIDFALAAPVLAQEKRQESADVVRMPPKDVITVSGKRWEEDLEKLGEEYFKTLGKPEESSTTLASSSSAPSGPDYGSTDVVQPPASNPASSAANPDPLTEPSSCSPSKQGLSARGTCFGKMLSYMAPENLWVSHMRDELRTGGWYDQTPALESDNDPNHWNQGRWRYHQTAGYGSESESDQESHLYQVDDANSPSTSGYAPGLSPTEHEHEHEVDTPPPPNLGSPKEPEDEVVPRPATSPDLDHQSLSADSQPVDLQAAAKGKAKESRRISGTATRDVRNAVRWQRELQPTTERPLDSEE